MAALDIPLPEGSAPEATLVHGGSPPVLSPLISEVKEVVAVTPGSFEASAHFYPRVLNAHIHPVVRTFLSLGNARIAKRYCHLHPEAQPDAVAAALRKELHHFKWAGADVFVTASARGNRRCVVVETNSCPSGQKSQPLVNDAAEQSGYKTLLEQSFMPVLRAAEPTLPAGRLAVLYDKNKMEASGYAATLADLTGEIVLLVPCFDNTPRELLRARFTTDGVLEVRTDCMLDLVDADAEDAVSFTSAASADSPKGYGHAHGGGGQTWERVRAVIRYVTQKPWNRIPPITRTLIYNPVLACLAGGRNKMLAAKAYDLHNAELQGTGLTINTPETMWNVPLAEIPLWVKRMGGMAVVKVPYANAGQGVWTIVNDEELAAFMLITHHYSAFIVQALIGNSGWSSRSTGGAQLYHVGTVPNARGNIHAFDLRMMVGAEPGGGFFPVAIYARRARRALPETLVAGASSWDILGTNLSIKMEDGSWRTQTERLLLMDSRDFNSVGIGLDDLIEAYMQTCLSMAAIDVLAGKLVSKKTGRFCYKLFESLNPDPALLSELFVLRDFNPLPEAPQPFTGLDFGVETLDPGLMSGGTREGSLNGGSLTDDESASAAVDVVAAAEGLQARSALTQSNLAALMAVNAEA